MAMISDRLRIRPAKKAGAVKRVMVRRGQTDGETGKQASGHASVAKTPLWLNRIN
jgi:hypothetical protein